MIKAKQWESTWHYHMVDVYGGERPYYVDSICPYIRKVIKSILFCAFVFSLIGSVLFCSIGAILATVHSALYIGTLIHFPGWLIFGFVINLFVISIICMWLFNEYIWSNIKKHRKIKRELDAQKPKKPKAPDGPIKIYIKSLHDKVCPRLDWD
jgi:predicted membrane protein